MIHPVLKSVTNDITKRSQNTRETYLARVDEAMTADRHRGVLACGNLAHVICP